MNFNNTFPEWKNTGSEPSTELKNAGFLGGYKPPATVFNWFWSKVMKAITEIQTKLSGLTKADVGLSDVDNTSDILKPVSMAMRSELDNKADAHNTQEGGQLGANSMALQGGAIGKNSYAGAGGAVGNNASAVNGFAGGDGAVTQTGASVGDGSYSETGGAVGDGAKAGAGFAGGHNAEIGQTDQGYIDAIQLGTGINQNAKTLQAYSYQLMDANGMIPKERLLNSLPVSGTYTGGSGSKTINLGFNPSWVNICPTVGSSKLIASTIVLPDAQLITGKFSELFTIDVMGDGSNACEIKGSIGTDYSEYCNPETSYGDGAYSTYMYNLEGTRITELAYGTAAYFLYPNEFESIDGYNTSDGFDSIISFYIYKYTKNSIALASLSDTGFIVYNDFNKANVLYNYTAGR